MAFMDFCCGFQVSSFESEIHNSPASLPLTASTMLTEQTSVILQAVDEKLSTQNRRIDGVERKVDKVITQLDAVLKKSEDHRDEDVSGAEQLRRHYDQLQDHAVRIKKLETVRNP